MNCLIPFSKLVIHYVTCTMDSLRRIAGKKKNSFEGEEGERYIWFLNFYFLTYISHQQNLQLNKQNLLNNPLNKRSNTV